MRRWLFTGEDCRGSVGGPLWMYYIYSNPACITLYNSQGTGTGHIPTFPLHLPALYLTVEIPDKEFACENRIFMYDKVELHAHHIKCAGCFYFIVFSAYFKTLFQQRLFTWFPVGEYAWKFLGVHTATCAKGRPFLSVWAFLQTGQASWPGVIVDCRNSGNRGHS
jgi:hypothetical protein